MIIRRYKPADLERLCEIYAHQGFEYQFPELEKGNFFSKVVLEDRGLIEMAVCQRLTAEVFLLVDPYVGNAAARWRKFQAIHRAAEHDAYMQGIDDVHCWLPPQIARPFGRRLVRDLGWVRDDKFTPYCKYLRPAKPAEGDPSWDEDLVTSGLTPTKSAKQPTRT